MPVISNAAVPVKPSQGGVFHIHHLVYQRCLEQNLDAGFVNARAHEQWLKLGG